MGSAWRDQSGGVRVSEIFNISLRRTVELSNLGTIIGERREALGLTQSGLAQLNGLSRQTLVGLESGALSDLGSNRMAQVLAVLGLDLDPPSQAARSRKRGPWMAAKNASVSHVHAEPPHTLGHALVSGSLPQSYAAHLTHLLDEAPVPPVVMAVEEAAANEGVAPKPVWRNVAKLARSLAVHRQGLRV
jgi:DNA-binding XRE family transcriptional regulator